MACRTPDVAVDYLIPARRRLEYRSYGSAGVAVHSTARGMCCCAPSADSTRWKRRLPLMQTTTRRRRDRATPAGPHTALSHWTTPIRTATAPTESRSCTTASSTTPSNCVARWSGRPCFGSEVDREVIAHLLERDWRPAVPLRCDPTRGRPTVRLVGSRRAGQGEDRVVVTAKGSPLVVAGSRFGTLRCPDLSLPADCPRTPHASARPAGPNSRAIQCGKCGRRNHRRNLPGHRRRCGIPFRGQSFGTTVCRRGCVETQGDYLPLGAVLSGWPAETRPYRVNRARHAGYCRRRRYGWPKYRGMRARGAHTVRIGDHDLNITDDTQQMPPWVRCRP